MIDEASSVIGHSLHTCQFPATDHPVICSSSWKTSIAPAVTVLPPPIVIAPADPEFDVCTPPLDTANSLVPATGGVEAPAVSMATEVRGRVPRPITGRGCRDQLPDTTAADAVVCMLISIQLANIHSLTH